MTLVVEDGTGLAGAESYTSVAEFDAYAGQVGYDLSGKSEAEKEQALRRATVWLDATYGPRFAGVWTTTTQALEWPRVGVFYRFRDIGSHEIPEKLKDALFEAAWRELVSRGSLQPDVGLDVIKSDGVGDSSTTYFANGVGAKPSFPVVDSLLSYFLTKRAHAYVGRAVRG